MTRWITLPLIVQDFLRSVFYTFQGFVGCLFTLIEKRMLVKLFLSQFNVSKIRLEISNNPIRGKG